MPLNDLITSSIHKQPLKKRIKIKSMFFSSFLLPFSWWFGWFLDIGQYWHWIDYSSSFLLFLSNDLYLELTLLWNIFSGFSLGCGRSWIKSALKVTYFYSWDICSNMILHHFWEVRGWDPFALWDRNCCCRVGTQQTSFFPWFPRY